MNQILRNEYAGQMLGVPGRFANVIGEPGATVVRNQTFTTEARPAPWHGEKCTIRAEVRFDDNCSNGHNSFAITGEVQDPRYRGDRGVVTCGSIHEDIEKAFPELAPLIRWHLTSSDGPMHYIANTVYHAGDRDHNGLRKGESRQIINGKTKLKCWELVAVNADGATSPIYEIEKQIDADEPPANPPKLEWRPWCRIGEGKARDLDAARHTAVWPDATDAELSVEPEALKAALVKRHAALVANFRQDMLGAGFIWTDSDSPAQVVQPVEA